MSAIWGSGSARALGSTLIVCPPVFILSVLHGSEHLTPDAWSPAANARGGGTLRMRSSSRAGLSRAELGRQAAAGEPHALRMLLERLYVDVVRYYGRWLRDHSDAGDLIDLLAEEALLRLASRQLPVLPTDDEWVAYALHVAHSVAIDLLDHDAVRGGAPAPGRLPGAGAPGRLQDAPLDPAPAGGAP